MESCQVQGKPELYGLGLRVAFYIQWFGAIIAEYLEVAGLPDIRFIGLLLSTAAFLGLVVKVSTATLEPADVYIVYLLGMGVYFFLVPLYIWRALTCFNPYWNPFRWAKETPSPAFKGLNFTLLLAWTALGIWFWCSFVPENSCSPSQYGFFFSRVSLGNKAFIAFNALLCFIILLACVFILLLKTGWKVPFWREKREKRKKRRIKRMHVMIVKELKTLSNIAVAATVTAAVELTVSWNHISDVNNISDVAQISPLLVSAGFFVRVMFLHFAGANEASDSSSDEDSDGGSNSYTTESQAGPPPPPPVHPRK